MTMTLTGTMTGTLTLTGTMTGTLTGTLTLTGTVTMTLTGTMTGTLTGTMTGTMTMTHRVPVGGSYRAPNDLFQVVLGMRYGPDEEWELRVWSLVYELGFLGIVLITVFSGP